MDVEELERLAQELVLRVRDDGPDDVNIWLSTTVPNSHELYRLAFVLACAVPDDRSWKALTAWTLFDRPVVQPEPPKPEPKVRKWDPSKLSPCGTWGAYQRHRNRREDACDDCKRAAREYYRDLRQRKRQAVA